MNGKECFKKNQTFQTHCLFLYGDFCVLYESKGRATLIVLRSVISIFTSASGGGWWKLFLVIKGMVVPDLKFKLFFHRFLITDHHKQ